MTRTAGPDGGAGIDLDAHKNALIDEVASRAVPVVGDLADSGRVREFLGHYLDHVDPADLRLRRGEDLFGAVASHYALARKRNPGETKILVSTPAGVERGWSLDGSTMLQVVADDRSFLVDSLAGEVTRQGWSIREVYHPQFQAIRDADGTLVDIVHRAAHDPRATPESWIHLEVYPPLGVSAADASEELRIGVANVLADVVAATSDWRAMLSQLGDVIADLDAGAPDERTPERREDVALLRWLENGRFTLLGYRQYTLTDGRFRPVPGTGLGILRGDVEPDDRFQAVPDPDEAADVMVFTKDTRRSTVHRTAYLDYVGIRLFDDEGRIVGERRFLGVLSSRAYTESLTRIPLLSSKLAAIIAGSGYDADSHGAKTLGSVLETYPRDELFRVSVDELAATVERIAVLTERRQVRAFVHRDAWHRSISVLVYLPRDRYNTDVRERMQRVLLDELGGTSVEFQARASESVLARLYFVVQLPAGQAARPLDIDVLEARLTDATRTWDDAFIDLVNEWPSERRGVEFSDAYKEDFSAAQGVADLEVINDLTGPDDLAFAVGPPNLASDAADVRLKVFRRGQMSLHDVMPHLAHLGVRVLDERPYDIDLRGEHVMIYDFGLDLPAGTQGWDDAGQARFTSAFEASYRGICEADALNALVLDAGLTWQQVGWLRGMSRYLRQTQLAYSQDYIAQALLANSGVAADLVAAFQARHDPAGEGDAAAHAVAAEEILAGIIAALDDVSSLDHDRIVRALVAFQRATVRTNAFVPGVDSVAYKLLPAELDFLPHPRPVYEIWVYSPQVEGVHLRFGKVARGGLRWSDRAEDFRTEVLGLVKAQMVKNTVIVPVGAKGGFVAKQLPDATLDRAAWQAEGIASYRRFVIAMLSVTDNIRDGEVVGPQSVVRHDEDDPYLVVAADKGTATFSDIANAISTGRDFWLGDAFASGGSDGYDHKEMGITARGAWESVKRHFREMGVDCQTTDVTVAGIGDMSGDVFGNGMLQSQHICLVAAFDHRHVFIDPAPDAATSFVERKRMFELPRSSWADYSTPLLSAGGGVYPRSLKSIPVTSEARAALGLPDGIEHLTPAEYIHHILQAPVDLLFNGGIGTYVKASSESNAEAGDKANDALRVDGHQVRARAAGEGGNLGWTQRGRIEYARAGGRINTDFIDNSAGVDTSDHEVNIKILLAAQIAAGRLTLAERDVLLPEMTDEIADLVLAHNVDANLAMANAVATAQASVGVHEDWMRVLEKQGYLDREVEGMPTSEEVAERMKHRAGLTSAELATLMAWTKIRLADDVLASDLPEDPYLADRLVQYFPVQLRQRFREWMADHPLHREIITTVAVNRFVNSQGIASFHVMTSDTGASAPDVMRAQLAARAVFRIGTLEVLSERQEGLDAAARTQLRLTLRELVESGARWILHNRRFPLDIQAAIDQFTEPVTALLPRLAEFLGPQRREAYQARLAALLKGGVSEELARALAGTTDAHHLPGIVQIAAAQQRDVAETARLFFAVQEELGLDILLAKAEALPRRDRWGMMARSAVRDELVEVTEQVVGEVWSRVEPGAGHVAALAAFSEQVPDLAQLEATLRELSHSEPDLAPLSVALRSVRSLLRAG